MAVLGYRLIGLVVWRALKWYLRSKLPLRRLVFGALLGLAGLIWARLAGRRLKA